MGRGSGLKPGLQADARFSGLKPTANPRFADGNGRLKATANPRDFSCGGFGVELGDFFLEEALGDGDVADELAFQRVVEAAGPGELADFADVVEDGAGDEEVGVDFGVEGCGGAADADEGEDMLEQAAEPGVVEALGGGGFEEGGAEGGVVEEGEDEAAEVRVLEGGYVAAELGGHGGDVVLGGGDEVCRVDFRGGGEAHLGEGDLELALVFRDLALDFDVAAGGAGLEDVGEVFPHAGFELAGLVGEGDGEVLAGTSLLIACGDGGDEEVAGDGLVFEAGRVGDEEIFHGLGQGYDREWGGCWEEGVVSAQFSVLSSQFSVLSSQLLDWGETETRAGWPSLVDAVQFGALVTGWGWGWRWGGGGWRDWSCQVGVDRWGDRVGGLLRLLGLLLEAFFWFTLLMLGLLLLGYRVAVETEGLGAQLLVRILGGRGGVGAGLGLGFRLGQMLLRTALLGLCFEVGVAGLFVSTGLGGEGIGSVGLLGAYAGGDGCDGLVGRHGDAGSLAGDGCADGGALGGLSGSAGQGLLRRLAVADLLAMNLLGLIDGGDRLAVILVYLGGVGSVLFGVAFARGSEFSLGAVGLLLLDALLLLDLLLERRRLVGGVGDLGGGLLGGGAGVDEAGGNLGVGVGAGLGEVGAEGGLKLLEVESLLHLLFDVGEGRNAGRLMRVYVEDDVALAGTDGLGVGADGEGEGGLLEDIAEGTALPVAEVSAASGIGAAGVGAGEGGEVSAAAKLAGDGVGLGEGGVEVSLGRVLGGGNEDLAEMHLLGDGEVLGVGVEVGELLGMSHVEMAADLVTHNLLADDLVADVLFEVFEGDALSSSGLLESLHGGEVVFLANVVELTDGFGVAGDAELLALGEEKLLIDEIAEEVIDAVVEVGLGEIVLAALLEELLLGRLVLGAGDDLVVDTRDGIFDDGAVGGDGRGRGDRRQSKGGGGGKAAGARLVTGLLRLRERGGTGNSGGGETDGGGDAGGVLKPALEVDACKLLGHPFLMQNRPFGVLARSLMSI